ncbi:hypothetical protein MAHJHV57_52240 [Mycobacterium avium subsp. hominissuis]
MCAAVERVPAAFVKGQLVGDVAGDDHRDRHLLVALGNELGTTVSLLVAEGDQQVAIAVIVPSHVAYRLPS